ncbi:hypothetical protein QQS21_000520 [Conoideocrella luteorostrata]|uniref:DNA2/NAM7 helicase-like C-terminal domain-containing protein n=1 Tax=Conoideocrella luteorostrata TaxID=1105319 RepID=A0AAJ0G3Y1_9HYPO|nr:hypothetical protein QQS21_000520 [Conoideocrella luteorostrata]
MYLFYALILIALDVILDFVKDTGADPKSITVITSYKANLDVLASKRRASKYDRLASMQPAATPDSFQSQEGDITFIIMGTTKKVVPGFTTDENWLNVMLSRQKSAVVIVGDANVIYALRPQKKGKGKNKWKGGGKDRRVVQVETLTGEKRWMKAAMLHALCVESYEIGRLIRDQVPPKLDTLTG